MTRQGARSLRIAALGAAIFAAACGGTPANVRSAAVARGGLHATGAGRPPLVAVEREGDARGAVAAAVSTEGIAPAQGALPGVALAALVQARLAARGLDATAVGGWDGVRVRGLVDPAAGAAKLVEGMRAAMLEPVAEGDPALEAIARRAAALARRPLADRALVEVAACTGEAFGMGPESPPPATEVESWRRAAVGLGRVAFATAGGAALADAAARALAEGPAWPDGAPATDAEAGPSDDRAVLYDASGSIAPGAARIVVTARTASPRQAVAAAPALGAPRGPLASRLAALDAPAHVASVIATAHRRGGCVAATIDLRPHDLASSQAARIATAAALARQEMAVEIADTTAPQDLGRELAARAADPREAAETAAWWALARGSETRDASPPRLAIVVGVAATHEASAPPGPGDAEALRAEIDRATIAWHAPAVESRTRVEHGQGETWILVASTCGTTAEATGDAGVSAVVAAATAAMGNAQPGDARVEPWVSGSGVGLLVHGPPHEGESSQAHARRLADLAARPFAADPLDDAALVRARTQLAARASEPEARVLGALGAALAPGHPSWVDPWGTYFGIAAATDDAVTTRASSMRAGPLRVAVLADDDEAQAQAAIRAVDRWIARRPGEARSCPSPATLPRVQPGTYAVATPPGAPSEAALAIALPPGDETADVDARWIAAALDGPDGLLARALSAAPAAGAEGLARAWGAAVEGGTRAPALVVRVTADDVHLDAAVAQTRALLDRLRQGALRDDDRVHAAAALARAAAAEALDPRARTIDLWRGEGAPPRPPPPTLDTLRAFAAATLHDDALVIVAARPPRPEIHANPARETHGRPR
ncbi:MAG TPA: hypothetical protein VGG39_13390 [Polyangiaceae bacterium]